MALLLDVDLLLNVDSCIVILPCSIVACGRLPLRKAAALALWDQAQIAVYYWPGTPEEYWEAFQVNGVMYPRLISRLEPEQLDPVNRGVIDSIREYYDGRQVNFTACMVVASGVR